MKIISTSFNNNEEIPVKYGCSGENISPQLLWSDFPSETKSFALICLDPDSPSGNFVHWLIANIPASVTEIEEGKMKIYEADNLVNDFQKEEYGGPCPSTGTHRYVFTIYALSIDKINDINKDNFLKKIKPYVIDRAEIVGSYKKQ